MMAGNHLTETFVYSGGFREVARGTWASPYFWTKLRPEGPKKFFWETAPLPYLRVWMTPNLLVLLDAQSGFKQGALRYMVNNQ